LIADTSFLIDLMVNDPAAVRKATEIEKKGTAISVCAPTIFELYVGVALSRKTETETLKVLSVVGSLPQLPLDFESARAGGSIFGARVRAGSQIDPEDAMIAGVAKVRGETILTRNLRHFSGIEGVTVEGY